MTAVTVHTRSANIKVKSISGVFTPVPGSAVTLNNQGSVAGAAQRLDGMADVVEGSTPANNYTLVYHSLDDKYYVEPLNLDGGSF